MQVQLNLRGIKKGLVSQSSIFCSAINQKRQTVIKTIEIIFYSYLCTLKLAEKTCVICLHPFLDDPAHVVKLKNV
ncbi:MAG: hypothetical protein JWP37_1197 [Mucilaginibacter sp.]|nr:hypothetical protein [Mucilaginibacter sp.]